MREKILYLAKKLFLSYNTNIALTKEIIMIKKVRKAIIPAAGLGTRFLPATKAMPKEMLPIVDIPTVQYIIQEAIDSGIEEILIIDNQYKGVIKTHFSRDARLENKLLETKKTKEFELVKQIYNIDVDEDTADAICIGTCGIQEKEKNRSAF
jgi:UTP--glucose-1-phosphate uridylyltransferase